MVKFRGPVISILCGLCLAGCLWGRAEAGYFSKSARGSAGAQFLNQGDGARATGMGGAYCAVADDASAIGWNPAGLARVTAPVFLGAHAFEPENTYYDFLGYVQPLSRFTLGLGLEYLSMLPLERLDESGNVQGTFTPYDLAVNLAYAVSFSGWQAGGNVKLINQSLDGQTAASYAFDLGAQMALAGEPFYLGAGIRNLGPPMQFLQAASPLPLTVRTGVSYSGHPNLLLACDLVAAIDDTPALHLGGEYTVKPSPGVILKLRAGFKTNLVDSFVSGLAFGFGAGYSGAILDYAWVPCGDLGSIHRLAISLLLGPGAETGAERKAAVKPLPAIPSAEIPEAPDADEAGSPSAKQAVTDEAKPKRVSAAATPHRPANAAAPARRPPLPGDGQGEPADSGLQYWVNYYYDQAQRNYQLKKYLTAYTYCDQALKWDPEHHRLKELMQLLRKQLDPGIIFHDQTPDGSVTGPQVNSHD